MDNESFLKSVDINFDRAAGLLGLSEDLAEQIKVANSTSVSYTHLTLPTILLV